MSPIPVVTNTTLSPSNLSGGRRRTRRNRRSTKRTNKRMTRKYTRKSKRGYR
jgi:hypothetical protein